MRKVLLILFIFVIILVCFSFSQANAAGDIINSADRFTNVNANGLINDTDMQGISNTLYNIFLAIGIVVAVAVAAVLGIQFMMGSTSEKAKVKESLLVFVIGCIIVFGAFGIWRALVLIGNKII